MTIRGKISRDAVAVAAGNWAYREKPDMRARFQIRSVIAREAFRLDRPHRNLQ